ncbi:MAG: hypothetical protein LBT85_02935 [Bifidobacteriaceae bacterium]|jgi:hypothetical protein|nr:hypothetical protein [Bifidobacteriaceae bacterium]
MVSEKIFIIPENPKGKAVEGSNRVVSVLKDYVEAAKGEVGTIVAEKGARVNLHEKEITEFLYKIYGGNFVYRKVSDVEGQKTSDIYWNGIAYDIKASSGTSKNAIDNRLRETKGQANRFIFDVTRSPLENNEIVRQTIYSFNSVHRRWLNEVILIRTKKVFEILRSK